MAGSNKAKIAKRVIEVLEYFDEDHQEATVMDIVRRYGHPQSSTSELLSTMVDLGLLYKNNYTRSYMLTPRAGLLGSSAQPGMIRNGELNRLMDRLAMDTGLGIGLFGMVNLNAQIFAWRNAPDCDDTAGQNLFLCGQQTRLCDTAAGWMLLSSIETSRCESMLRHLHADGGCSGDITLPQLRAAIELARQNAYVGGPAGFGSKLRMSAILLPQKNGQHFMALTAAHNSADQIDEKKLTDYMKDTASDVLRTDGIKSFNSSVCKLPHAA